VQPQNILIVEDSTSFSVMLRHLLKRVRFLIKQTFIAPTLADAMKHIQESAIDLILLDLNLPDSSGLSTFASVHKVAGRIPIIIITSMDDENLALVALKRGAQDYVIKGEVSAKTLQKTILYSMERIERQKLEAEKVELYEQREDLIATIADDLKSPLIRCVRALEMLAKGQAGTLNEGQKTSVLEICDDHDALLNLVNKLIEMMSYDKEQGRTGDVDIVAIVTEYARNFKPSIDAKNIELRTEFVQPLPTIVANRGAIRQLVRNLLESAVTFTPVGSWIGIKIWHDDTLNIEITDTGPPLTRGEPSKIFERPNRARLGDRDTHGFRLSLYLCKRLVDALGGNISCKSQVNLTSFMVRLPVSDKPSISASELQ
jgi:signal transduction histidine kinase